MFVDNFRKYINNITLMQVMFFQVRDEYRTDYDGGRGGYGKIIAQKITPNTLER